MAIGYANFSDIQQGNQQVVNSLANLGNQIGQTIETHAATESAKTMLPMLQQQYATGMQKIASGEQGGMADVIQAASLASQNPITAGYGKNMIDGMTQLSHMANTQAYLQGTKLSSMASHPEMYNPDGTFNTSRLGQAAPAKPYTPYQQEQSDRNAATDRNAQLDAYSQLYSGNGDKEIGISGYADKINKAIKDGTDVSAEDLQNFAKRYGYYKQKQSNYGKNALNDENIDQAYNDIKDHLTVAQGDLDNKIKEAKKKGEDPTKASVPREWLGSFGNIWPAKKDLSSVKTNLDETLKNLEGIHNIGKQGSAGRMPSTRGGSVQNLQQSSGNQLPSVNSTSSSTQSGSSNKDEEINNGNAIIQLPTGKRIKTSDYQNAIDQLIANPDTASIFNSHFGKGAAEKILNSN